MKRGKNKLYRNDDSSTKETIKFVYIFSFILFIPTCYAIWHLYNIGRAVPECTLFFVLAIIFHWIGTISIADGKIDIKTAGVGLIQRSKEPFRFWLHMTFGIILYMFFFWFSPFISAH